MSDETPAPSSSRETSPERPKLRRIERVEKVVAGERVIVLRDPMGLAESFALDADFAPVLDALDGTRTTRQVAQSLRMRGVLDIDADELAVFVDELRAAAWLDDDAFRARWSAAHAEFLDEDPRAPRFAGVLYPERDAELRSAYRDVLGSQARIHESSQLCGVLVPHGPLEATGEVLSRTLVDMPPADRLDCVVVLGTDHGPGLLPFAVARRGFATPLGTIKAHEGLLDALDRRVEWAYREELRHRSAFSIELAAVTLQAIYGEQAPPIVPILCGPNVLRGRETEAADHFIATLELLLEGTRALIWGSAELSHGGVAYGRPPLDDGGRAALEDRDRQCLDDFVQGRIAALVRTCKAEHPQGRPSGGAVMRTMRELLPDARAEVSTYRSIDVGGDVGGDIDGTQSGFAGLAGVRFHTTGAAHR